MRTTRNALLVLLAAVAAFVTARPDVLAREQLTAEAQLDYGNIRLGESVGFSVVVRGADSAEPPPDSAFGSDFDVQYQGAHPTRRTGFIEVNGVRREMNEISVALVWVLRPTRAGRLTVPAMTVETEGEKLTTEPQPLGVLAPRETEFASLAVSFDPPRVAVEQPVTFRLEITLQRARYGRDWYGDDPWFARDPMELHIPWFAGLENFSAEPFERFARRFAAGRNRQGFSVNGITSQGLFSTPLLFSPPREDVSENGREYFRYVFEKTMVPLDTGSISVPVATLYGQMVTDIEARGNGFIASGVTDVFVAHEPATLEVLPVPSADRPPTYSHAVGTYEVEAAAVPSRVQVGDPIRLELTVRGDGLLHRLEPPRLDRQDDLAADFAIADGPAREVEDDTRTFEFTLRPRHSGITHIPPIQFASYDGEQGGFVVSTSDAIDIEVVEASSVALSEVVGGQRTVQSSSTPGEELTGGLLGNMDVSGDLVDETPDPLGSPVVWLLVIAPPLLFLGAFIVARRRDAKLRDPLGGRAEAALANARSALDDARAAAGSGDGVAATDALQSGLVEFLLARTRRPPSGLTAQEAGQLLDGRVADAELIERVVATLTACETARFGGGAADRLSERIDETQRDIESLAQGKLS